MASEAVSHRLLVCVGDAVVCKYARARALGKSGGSIFHIYSHRKLGKGLHSYSSACFKLIAQYKTCMQSLPPDFNINDFIHAYDIRCPAARHRLVEIAVPATTEHVVNSAPANTGTDAKAVAETVQSFITLMDAIKLNMVAVDQIHPLLGELLQGIAKVKLHGAIKMEWRDKLKDWLIKLNQMNAHEELKQADSRQLMFDLENAHSAFMQCLSQ